VNQLCQKVLFHFSTKIRTVLVTALAGLPAFLDLAQAAGL
jgi:hypothetical protein